ncbi:Mg(2+) transport ATPase, P-type [Rhodococcus aetherivorans]|uniref:Magnesium-transporting ATPase, P-type 1 n=1 Tax=Rhodococcus aetherivorans TaxID=191292 RepID=A0AA46SFJ4_9NOCA|nr:MULTISPECIES: magnesium-translocating P-type ATPase [Rhodococcus]ETT25333.1 magnesium-translocating P-type ATPase [Rhodococcus rhodochrous ATCC 21198]ANZ24337.1 magnesium-translocating P-type ATPase [Rhodococcus sp. WB1]NGP27198.1 magnesium-translocating P-type ATPase [Rhodococcus aetherivorans]PND51492.1 magnesium-translocating P-type ATPase [Rhodococcus sp. ENV425]UGQ42911.1 magnesium-translocating P-type ATPase [Rhodococcus aetherivorans]
MTGLPVLHIAAADAAAGESTDVLSRLQSSSTGLSSADAAARLAVAGPNAVRSHGVSALAVLGRQLRSALLLLLSATAVASFFLGDRNDAVIIGVILLASIGLGFVNEYRAERASAALHSRQRHTVVVLRDGAAATIDVTELVPGDVVHLVLGELVPADLRLLSATGLECDESVLTGESEPAAKSVDPVPPGTALADLAGCAFMGTVVHAGTGTGVVVATGADAEFGRIAVGLGEREPETEFQIGLRRFSVLLLQVAVALTATIVVTNLVLQRPLIESLLFAFAIAVGITPQLLPAVVSTSLAEGSRRLARRKVLVKRLVCIEDLGDIDILLTDKTGTLTDGRIGFREALAPSGAPSSAALLHGLLATETDTDTAGGVRLGSNALDTALWAAAGPTGPVADGYTRLATLPFDHERRMSSTLVRGPDGESLIVVKGAPETVLDRCADVGTAAHTVLNGLFAQGSRVVAVASKPAPGHADRLVPDDEHGLILTGFLVFLDRPKTSAAASLTRLAALGITVKVATGDNPQVAEKVCADLGLVSGGSLTGSDLAGLDDAQFSEAALRATIFARVSPEQKARLVETLRTHGRSVGFLGDGVNDALALHTADVGISVDSATDVAKDAADVVLLEKDLGVLADGVTEGRRTFTNTIKYVLMSTSSNFGNMFSAAAASAVLDFLPMLPSQILLNNLLYDTSQLAIPGDRVDEEQLHAPSHWDIAFIRRFMLFFGPISSLFDFITFGIMLGVFAAGPELFHTGWFVESLATQTLIVFAIRTRRVPFLRSRPSLGLVLTVAGVLAVGIAITVSPLGADLGFTPLPIGFFLTLVVLVIGYLVLIEYAKRVFYAEPMRYLPAVRWRGHEHRIHRRAARFSTPTHLRAPTPPTPAPPVR